MRTSDDDDDDMEGVAGQGAIRNQQIYANRRHVNSLTTHGPVNQSRSGFYLTETIAASCFRSAPARIHGSNTVVGVGIGSEWPVVKFRLG